MFEKQSSYEVECRELLEAIADHMRSDTTGFAELHYSLLEHLTLAARGFH
jgi:hypothetical protein